MLSKLSALVALPALLLGALATNPLAAPQPAVSAAWAQDTQCSIENTVFQHGEEIVYRVYYNWNFVWMSAGEVVFRVADLGDRYHLTATGTTYKAYDAFFKIRDRYEAYVDKKTLLPITSSRDVQEGKYRLFDKLTFDRKRGVVKSLRGKTREVAEVTEYPVDQCIHDILSLLYSSRNLDFDHMKPGQDFPIKIFMDKETWPLRVNYRGKEPNKKIRNLGRFNTIVFNPEVIKGYIFKDDSNLRMWVTDDQNRLPLMIESPISIGSVKVVLKSYKNLRYELTAKVKEQSSTAPASAEEDTADH